MSASKIVEIALAEVGYMEKATNSQLDSKSANAGYNNYTKYGVWYGSGVNGQPWCDAFVSWCAYLAGEAEAVGRYCYCPSHVQFFKNQNRWHSRSSGYTPVAGDIIFFGDADHVGIVQYVSGGYVHTIEGNTRAGNTMVANGGGVYQKSYDLNYSYIMGYGHPNYSADTGWQKNDNGWWYVLTDGTYPKDTWRQIDGHWYWFDAKGYCAVDTTIEIGGVIYTFDSDGHVIATEEKKEEPQDDPKTEETEEEDEVRYTYLKDVESKTYRATLDKLIEKGVLKGKGGEGEDRIIDLSEDTVRVLVMLDRAGQF